MLQEQNPQFNNKESEQWLPVVGYEGLYEVSNYGRVASLNYRRTGKRKLLSLNDKKNRYLQVSLCDAGKYKSFSVHYIVATAFIPNPKNNPEIRHIDGNPSNNYVQNLCWSTPREHHIAYRPNSLYQLWKRAVDAGEYLHSRGYFYRIYHNSNHPTHKKVRSLAIKFTI